MNTAKTYTIFENNKEKGANNNNNTNEKNERTSVENNVQVDCHDVNYNLTKWFLN